MTTAPSLLAQLSARYTVDWEFQDTEEARAEIADFVERPLLHECPELAREVSYLEVLRLTGGFHAHDSRVSFGLFGFGDQVTSFLDGEPISEGDRWFRFADLMLPEFDDNLAFVFDLEGNDQRVFSVPGNELTGYELYAESFEDLFRKIARLE